MIKFNNFYNNNLIQPPLPPPQPLLRQYQQQPQQQYRRANPELMIQNVTSAKILQEQQEARSPAGIHIHPDHLIRSITEWKITQYRASARLKAEKEQAERIKRAKRTIAPMDLSGLHEDSMVKLADLMAALPASYGKEYRYSELTKPVPLATQGGRYSTDHILIVGAQLELAKIRLQQTANKASAGMTKTVTTVDGINQPKN